MDIKPLPGRLQSHFSGPAANEPQPLHEQLLTCMALEQDELVLPFRDHLIEIFKQMNLWEAQKRPQMPVLADQRDGKLILQSSAIALWLRFTPAAWDMMIDGYAEDLRVNDPALHQQLSLQAIDRAIALGLDDVDEKLMRAAFTAHYATRMNALQQVAQVMQNHLPHTQAYISIETIPDEDGESYVQPVLELSTSGHHDLRDVVRNFIERKAVFGLVPALS